MTLVADAATTTQLGKGPAIGIGLLLIIVGVVLICARSRLTAGLNRLYVPLPGKVRYPDWFVPAFGMTAFVFGLAVMVLAATLGH